MHSVCCICSHVDVKQKEHVAPLRMAPDNRGTINQAQVDIDDSTVKPMATEEKGMLKNTVTTELSEQNHSYLLEKLTKHSVEWKEIGSHLGFLPSELNNIQARPLLLSNAPNSWLSTMLAEWLQWAPGDSRGSTSTATVDGLRDALNKAGLGETAHQV